MRLVTWNIHGGLGRDGRRDLGRIAALLEDMRSDVAALQEVGDAHRGNVERELADQASWLGRRLGWFVAYGPNLGRLRDLKTKYDPENFFHTNVNILPR